MATTTVTVGLPTISAEARIAYERTLLIAVRPALVHAQFAEKHPIPKGMGQSIQLRRFELLTPNLTPLTEGVTPNGNTITVTSVTLTIQWYGDFVQFSDVVDWVSIDDVVTETVKQLGQEAGNVIDQLARNAFNLGTGVRYANGRVSRITVAAGDVVTGIEIQKCARTLSAQNAERVAQYYVAIIHPYVTYDLQRSSDWLLPREYSAGQTPNLYMGEVGQLWGVRFVETTNAQIFVGAGAGSPPIDVYSTLVFGAKAVGASELTGHALQTILKPLGSAGAADPLDQRQTCGWKASFAAGIQDQLRILRLESAVSS